jgi:DHA1 family inner membrane transport protein
VTTPAPAVPARRDPRPDGAARRRFPLAVSLTALALGGFGIGTTEFVSMGLLPQIAGDLGATVPEGGHLVSAYAVGVVVGAPLVAVLAARLPRTGLLVALMSAFALGNALSALAPTFGSLVAARFAAGLPHGAYFGIGALVAAGLVPPDRRGRAVAVVMSGLTVANLLGVPASAWLGQAFGWRTTYWLVTVVAVLAAAAVAATVPRVAAERGAGMRSEVSALRRPQVWFALGTGAVGFGGMFAVYSYLSPLVTEVTGWSVRSVPVVLAVYGLGMTLGMPVGGRLVDWSVSRSVVIGLGGMLALLLTLPLVAATGWAMLLWVFCLAFAASVTVPALQTRLMDVAGQGQSLAASLNHSAFNVANAAGAFGGGLVIEAGLGWTSPALLGAGLAAAGLLVVLAGRLAEVRARVSRPAPAPAPDALSLQPR